jgi:hypothetical protein
MNNVLQGCIATLFGKNAKDYKENIGGVVTIVAKRVIIVPLDSEKYRKNWVHHQKR